MPAARLTMPDAEFASVYQSKGPRTLELKFNVSARTVQYHRARVEQRLGIVLQAPSRVTTIDKFEIADQPHRRCFDIKNGHAFVASDFHCWPGKPPLMHRALVKLAKDMEPQAFIANGDVLDFASISRHPRIGWEHWPTVSEELDAAAERLDDIASVLKRGCHRIWTGGNHDFRFETIIANKLPELAKVKGVHLHDHYPLWQTAWSCWINDDVVIKHRYKGGKYAPYNNTVHAGKSVVTGHQHSAKVMPHDDYNGTRYGVDAGCVASPNHQAFVDYTEDNPKDWREAFCVLTFRDGKLMLPELVLRWDDTHVQFRGDIIAV